MSRQIGPYALKNPWVLAPMAGVSEQPFRVMAFRHGGALCPTELVSPQGVWRRNFLQMADALGNAGVAALAVHPRTRAQGYSGKADWQVITDLKRHVGEKFPVIGNGDVKTPADALRMLETTGCDFVMIGRGALG